MLRPDGLDGARSSGVGGGASRPHRPLTALHQTETHMPKGQRNSKEAKKPKKDQSPSKPISSDAVMPTKVTLVPERSKKK
jgi:hypothetical protein